MKQTRTQLSDLTVYSEAHVFCGNSVLAVYGVCMAYICILEDMVCEYANIDLFTLIPVVRCASQKVFEGHISRWLR